MNLLQAINLRMIGDAGCPRAGSLGECAALNDLAHGYWEAYLYLWKAAADLKASECAAWFTELGCTDVCVSATLHDPDNDVFEGSCAHDGVRPWTVTFLPPEGALK